MSELHATNVKLIPGDNPYYGGGGGGGYMGNGGSPYGASQDSPSRKGGRANQTLRPVTIKQIREARQPHPDADWQIDGHDVSHIHYIGSVHNMATTATSVMYEIGDGTGYIETRQWLDSEADEQGKTDGVGQDKYVSVIGTLKKFNDKLHVSAQQIRPVTNPDEVYNHLLKALAVSLSFRRGPNGAPGGAGGVASANDYAAPGNGAAGNASEYADLPPLERRIMEIISAVDDDDGVHVSNVSRQCGGSGEEVMSAIENLMAEGRLFSTIDDLHVKAA